MPHPVTDRRVYLLDPTTRSGCAVHVGDESRPVRNGAVKIASKYEIEGLSVGPGRLDVVDLELDVGRLEYSDSVTFDHVS